ncbi:MAG: T9SS type A sorting domain-containing protein [Chitinophagales bacterium]
MKKAIIIFFLALIGINANAQGPFVQWQRCLGGSNMDQANDIKRTSDSGYIVVSVTASSDGDITVNHGLYDSWLVKLSSWGDIVWQKSYGGSDNDDPYSVQQTTDGGYVFAGKSKSVDGDVTGNHGVEDFWIVKVDDTGRIQWENSYGGSGQDVALSMQQTTDGGYIVAGFTKSADGDVTINHGGEDVWVIKLSSTGSLVWQKTYGGTGDDLATSIQQTTDGGYIVAGISNSTDGDVTGNHGGNDIWILKLSATGSIVWENSYGGSGDEADGDEAYPGTVQQTIDGGYVFAGTTNSTDGDVTGYHGGLLFDYWVVKVSATGSMVWAKCFGGTGDDDAYFVQQTRDTGYIVTGTSNSTNGDITHNLGTYDYWILKLNSSGNLVWEKNYGGSLDDYGFCIHPTSDSEYIVCGYSGSNDSEVSGNHGAYDGWVVKLAYCNLPAVSAISGPPAVCASSGIHLSDNTTGGTWSASNGNATVSGGLVTGLYTGNDAIFYTKTNSCGTGGATHIVNINPRPNPVIVAAGTTLSTTLTYSAYQWIKNGTNVSGATNATYTATANGIYSVTVTDANGCTGTSVADTVSGIGVSIINKNFHFSIIPNPTTGTVYIEGTGNINIRVYNIMGQLMKEAANTDNISIAELPGAMYLIRLFDTQGRFIRQEKILKE